MDNYSYIVRLSPGYVKREAGTSFPQGRNIYKYAFESAEKCDIMYPDSLPADIVNAVQKRYHLFCGPQARCTAICCTGNFFESAAVKKAQGLSALPVSPNLTKERRLSF
ncbi:MAG: hypothetical protein HFE95_00270 [Acutalibacter sp.]|nr:hypothetical protein [Acutalibacter sp.]